MEGDGEGVEGIGLLDRNDLKKSHGYSCFLCRKR